MEKNIQIERNIALGVCEKLFIATPGETNFMRFYRNGIFIHDKYNGVIKQHIKEIAKNTLIPNGKDKFNPYNLSIAKQNMIIDFIKSFTLCKLDDFDSDPRIINCKNGLYYLDGYKDTEGKPLETQPQPRELTEGEIKFIHDTYEDPEKEIKKRISVNVVCKPILITKYFRTHEDYIRKYGTPYKSFMQIPVNYDPKVETTEINQIFTDIFGFEDVSLIYEMIGYFILPTTKYSKAFMLYGQTGTGKTTFIKIITQFIGHNNTSGIELQKLDDKFEIEKTRNKNLNIFDDLSSKPIKFVGNFKKLVTNTDLYGRIKHIQEEIKWKNKCKGLFACNVLPKIEEYVTDAFYIRWVLIPCFKDMKDLPKGINAELREKTYSEQEMSGLLNKAILGIARLESDKGFPEKWQNIEFVRNYWNMDINPVSKFVNDCCELGEFFEVDYELFYTEVNKFRIAHQVKEIEKRAITIALKKLNIEKKDRGSKVPKEERFYYKGIQFKLDFISENIKIETQPNLVKYMNER